MYQKITKEQKKDCDRKVIEFCQKYDLSLPAGYDIVKICKSLGFKVLSLSLTGELGRFDGVILVNPEQKVIGINNKLDMQKARFTIAHELSHYIYNDMSDDRQEVVATRDTIFHKEAKPIIEHMMDYMAATLLVPENEFKKALSALNVVFPCKAEDVTPDIIDYLAYKFIVDKDVIRKRFDEVA